MEAGAKVSAKKPRSVSIPEDAGRKLSDVRRTISSVVAVETSSSATPLALWQGVQPDWEHVAALLRKRLELMFLGQKRAPSRSELEPFAVHSTLRYCEEVSLAVGRFWKAERALIKESFGPTTLIAEEEVRGYLAADGLGEPLLTAKQADDVGTRVRNGANKAVKERASAKEATRTAIRAATRHGVAYCGDDSATAVARALSALYDLALPGSKRDARQKRLREMSPAELSAHREQTLRAQVAAQRAARMEQLIRDGQPEDIRDVVADLVEAVSCDADRRCRCANPPLYSLADEYDRVFEQNVMTNHAIHSGKLLPMDAIRAGTDAVYMYHWRETQVEAWLEAGVQPCPLLVGSTLRSSGWEEGCANDEALKVVQMACDLHNARRQVNMTSEEAFDDYDNEWHAGYTYGDMDEFTLQADRSLQSDVDRLRAKWEDVFMRASEKKMPRS